MRLKKWFAIFVLAALPLSAGAQAYLFEGDYEGHGEGTLSMRTLVLDDDKGVVAAKLGVGAKGCGGSFTGIGQVKGTTLELRPYASGGKDALGAKCVVTVTFDKSGKTAIMDEGDCRMFHGAACGFSGKLSKKR